MIFFGRHVLVVEDEFPVHWRRLIFWKGLGCVIVGPVACLTTAVKLARSEILDAAVLDMDIAGAMVWPVAEELRGGVP